MMVTQFLDSPWIQALGWTLLHSLWQGLVCLLFVLLLLRCIPSRLSTVRYWIATASLFAIIIFSLTTFTYLTNSSKVNEVVSSPSIVSDTLVSIAAPDKNYFSILLARFVSGIQDSLPVIVLLWSIGTLLFSTRLFGGWLMLIKLRATATVIDGDWNNRVRQLANKLGINQLVSIAESAATEAPVVIGYLKPMILMPIGMISGLSTEQLESIIIHELIHIRRGDYLINLLQSLLETLFFFNPFVWIISSIIRREREHCCDDAVIKVQGDPLVYARALTAVEEARLSRMGLALSFAENKHQLLNRIKRIMEKSAQTYSLRERIVPAILIITGLVCASWLTVQSGKNEKQKENESTLDQTIVSPDTTIRIERSGRYYKKTITTIGADGKPNEEVVEEYNGDDELRPLIAPVDFGFNMSAIPAIPPMPPIDAFLSIQAMPGFNFNLNHNMDTIPFPGYAPGLNWGPNHEWEEFGREFESSFKERFGDFYEKHEQEIETMMKELESHFNDRSMEDWEKHRELLSLDSQIFELQHEEMWAQHEEHLKEFEQNMEHWAEENEKNFQQLEEQFKAMEDSRRVLEKELQEELVKDGYLGENETIRSIEINDDAIKINDTKIKDTDQKKYRDLLKKNSFGPDLDWHSLPPKHFGGRRE